MKPNAQIPKHSRPQIGRPQMTPVRPGYGLPERTRTTGVPRVGPPRRARTPRVPTRFRREHAACAWLLFGLVLALLLAVAEAQARTQQSGGSSAAGQEESKKDESKQEESKKRPEEPVRWRGMITRTTLEFGWREVWRHGNSDVYRSQVNLGDGLRLLGLSTEMRAEGGIGALFDYLSYDMSSWGGDPYNTLRLRVEKHRAYRLDADYRRIDYFNFLPNYANPLLISGVFLGQHSFDSARRMTATTLTIFPDTQFQFHLGYDRNSAFGRSFTTYSVGLDEFLLSNRVRATTDEYRAGFDWSRRRLSLTLEQGFRYLRDDPTTFQPEGIINFGNSPNLANPNSANAQQILLTAFSRSTAQRVFVPTLRFALQARPVDRLTFTGRFAYSDASLDFLRSEVLRGTLFDRGALRYFSQLRTSSLSEASQPSSVADGSVNFQVSERFSLVDTFRFNHFTIAGDALARTSELLGQDLRGSLPPPGQGTLDLSTRLAERTALGSISNQVEGIIEPTSHIVLRAGYRFAHRSARRFPTANNIEEESSLDAHTFLAGASFRLRPQLRVFFQLERGQGDNVFTRISPKDFVRVRLRGTYRPNEKFALTTTFGLYDSTNPNPVVNNDQQNRNFTIAGSYSANSHLTFNLTYTFSDITSLVDIINPRTRETTRQRYEAQDHYADTFIEIIPTRDWRMDIGYAVVNANGTFPLNYHQPTGRISYTYAKRYNFFVDWRWWGYNERGLALQDYRAHALTGGLRLSL